MYLKKTIALCAAAFLLLAGSGCSNTDGTQTQGNEKVKVSLAFWEPSVDQEYETAFKEIIKKYNEVKPNVSIELISQPYEAYQQWITSQFSANSAPTIEYNHSGNLYDQYTSGLLVDMKDDFKKPNPYADNKPWEEVFIDGKCDIANNYTDSRFAVPFSGLGIAFYYNKDVYKALGLSEPKTWDEFLANCEVISQTDTNPIAFMAMKNDAIDWLCQYITTGLFGDMILADKDVNYNGDNVIDEKEIIYAVKNGALNLTEGKYKEIYEQMLDIIEIYSKYAQNSVGLDEVGAKAQFIGGKAAHIMSGSWDVRSFLTDQDKNFEVGAFALPNFTKENGPYAGENMVVTVVQPLAVTASAKDDPKVLEAAEDFLMFLTAPDNYKSLVETTYSIPIVKDVDVDSVFTAFTAGSRPPIGIFTTDAKLSSFNGKDAVRAVLSNSNITREKILQDVNQALEMWSDERIEKYGVSAENNYGVDELTKIGTYVLTK